MTPQQRTRLQNGLMLVSFLIAGAGTGFWVRIQLAGGHPPLWLMALVGYGWIFVVFLGLNYAARQFSQARRASGTPYMPRGVNPRPVPTPQRKPLPSMDEPEEITEVAVVKEPPLRNPRPTPKPPLRNPRPTPKPPLRNPRPTPKPPEKKLVPETDDDLK